MNIHRLIINTLLPLLSAALLVAAAPPFDLWPLALVALVPLYLGIRRAAPLPAALMGWLAGFAALMAGTRWWAAVLQDFVQLSEPSALGVMICFAAYQALVFGLWAGGLPLIKQFSRLNPIVAGPLWFAVCEAALPFFLKMYLGITVWRAWPLTQAAEIGGPAAVSALVVLINIVMAEGMLTLWRRRVAAPAFKWGAVAVVAIIAAGTLRGWHVSYMRSGGDHLKVGLVQPNFGVLSQETRKHAGFKYVHSLQRANAALSARGADLIVWPESMWPYALDRKMDRDFPAGHPWNLRGEHSGRLLVGALTHRFENATPRDPNVNNSAILISAEGGFSGRYDKNHLLPFGEVIPLADRYPGAASNLRTRMPQWPHIHPGSGGAVLRDGHLKVGVMICSEDLLVKYGAAIARNHPNLLASMANDAWFGHGAAPLQHLALAAFRAIEARRDLVRCTNTGVSAIVDAVGRVRLQGPRVEVSPNRPKPPTLLSGRVALSHMFALGPYTIGLFPWVCAVVLVGLAVVRRLRQKEHLMDEQQSLNPNRGLI